MIPRFDIFQFTPSDDMLPRFSACASDLGYTCGMAWPKSFTFHGGGNGQPLYPARNLEDGSVTYRQDCGILEVTIWND